MRSRQQAVQPCRVGGATSAPRRRRHRFRLLSHSTGGTQNWLRVAATTRLPAAAIRKPPRVLRARRFHRLECGCQRSRYGTKTWRPAAFSHRRHRQRALRPRHASFPRGDLRRNWRVRRLAPARGAGRRRRRRGGARRGGAADAGERPRRVVRALRGARAPSVGALPRVRPLRLADGPPLLAPPLLRRRRQPGCLLAADRPRARDQRLLPGPRDRAAARRRVRRALGERAVGRGAALRLRRRGGAAPRAAAPARVRRVRGGRARSPSPPPTPWPLSRRSRCSKSPLCSS